MGGHDYWVSRLVMVLEIADIYALKVPLIPSSECDYPRNDG